MEEEPSHVTLRVDYAALATDPNLPGAEHTRADGTPITLPDGWNLSECVAVMIEAMVEEVHDVETPLQRSDAADAYEFEATVTAGTEQIDDERIDRVTRHAPDGPPTRHEGETSTEEFDLDDALSNL
jgi:hypothetical protein